MGPLSVPRATLSFASSWRCVHSRIGLRDCRHDEADAPCTPGEPLTVQQAPRPQPQAARGRDITFSTLSIGNNNSPHQVMVIQETVDLSRLAGLAPVG